MTDNEAKNRVSHWFIQWRSPLRNFLRSRGVPHTVDIDDVAQEVFLRLMRYDRVDLIKNPQAYLFKMATNVASEWAIRLRHSQPHQSKWLAQLVSTDQPERSAGQCAIHDEIKCAIQRLPARNREVLQLLFVENLNRAEIAVRVGTTERSVKRALIKSYEQLRLALDPKLLGDLVDGSE
jgi:RNA polymerase sigma-70 factor (ECF subfamily)